MDMKACLLSNGVEPSGAHSHAQLVKKCRVSCFDPLFDQERIARHFC